jgi:hypothetical protein
MAMTAAITPTRPAAGAFRFARTIEQYGRTQASESSCPAKAGHPVNTAVSALSEMSPFTGSPAFAGDDEEGPSVRQNLQAFASIHSRSEPPPRNYRHAAGPSG